MFRSRSTLLNRAQTLHYTTSISLVSYLSPLRDQSIPRNRSHVSTSRDRDSRSTSVTDCEKRAPITVTSAKALRTSATTKTDTKKGWEIKGTEYIREAEATKKRQRRVPETRFFRFFDAGSFAARRRLLLLEKTTVHVPRARTSRSRVPAFVLFIRVLASHTLSRSTLGSFTPSLPFPTGDGQNLITVITDDEMDHRKMRNFRQGY